MQPNTAAEIANPEEPAAADVPKIVMPDNSEGYEATYNPGQL
jgi:hypothetical protein